MEFLCEKTRTSAVEPVVIPDRNKISAKTINTKDEYAFTVASLIITHNVIRRQLLSIIGKAPTVPPAQQEAFLKYASFATWHVTAYLRSTVELFGTSHDSAIPPYITELEFQLASAPVESDSLPLDDDAWSGGDIALAAERLADVLLPQMDRRENLLKASARGLSVQALRNTRSSMEKTIKDSKVGHAFAMAMIAAHQTKAETAMFPSVSKMAGGMMYGRWTKFAK